MRYNFPIPTTNQTTLSPRPPTWPESLQGYHRCASKQLTPTGYSARSQVEGTRWPYRGTRPPVLAVAAIAVAQAQTARERKRGRRPDSPETKAVNARIKADATVKTAKAWAKARHTKAAGRVTKLGETTVGFSLYCSLRDGNGG